MYLVDRNIIDIRISKLHDYLLNLEKLKKYSLEEFQSDLLIYSAAERQLHLAIECVQDIASHIIADGRLGSPSTNKDIYVILSRAKIIPNSLAEKLADMAKFRNILVHDYISLDRNIVYNVIHCRINDIIEFVKHVIKSMEN